MDTLRQLKLIKKEAARIADFYDNFQAGSGITDALGDAAVAFPGGFAFASAPRVFVQPVDAAARGIVLDVVSKSATGFIVKARKVTGLPTGSALQGMHYTTASAVTGIPSGTGSGGVDHTHGYSGTTGGASAYSHTHGIGAASTGTFVTSGSDPGHSHTNPSTGAPSTTATVASSTHTHSGTASGTTGSPSATVTSSTNPAGWSTKYAATSSGGSPTSAFQAASTTSYQEVASDTHTHTFSDTFTTGAPSTTATVASSTHTHTQGDTGSSYTGITLYTASAVTGIPSGTGSGGVDHTHGYSGTTGGASAYSHTHGIGAASTGTFVTSLIIDPTDWITVVTGDPQVLAVDFDFFAILT